MTLALYLGGFPPSIPLTPVSLHSPPLKIELCLLWPFYWVGHLSFSIRDYRKTQMNFFAQPNTCVNMLFIPTTQTQSQSTGHPTTLTRGTPNSQKTCWFPLLNPVSPKRCSARALIDTGANGQRG